MSFRRVSKEIFVGNVKVGGDSEISIQSMTNTITSNSYETIKQIRILEEAGVDIVRVSCPDEDSTKSLKEIIKSSNVPIIADIHFHYKRAIESADVGAACIRINPGNIGSIDRIKEVVIAAKNNNCAIRIGINAASLERNILKKYKEPCSDAMVESALMNIKILEDLNFSNIKISVKSSDVLMTIDAYEKLANLCNYPFHLGITEAGGLRLGTVKSSIGIGYLLLKGIGDTLRVSLSAHPKEEVKVGFDILKSLNIRHRGAQIISCPTCARKQFDVIKVSEQLELALENNKTPIKISVIGCVVNGPGEALFSDIGITAGSNNTYQIYIKGSPYEKFVGNEDSIIERILDIINNMFRDI